MLRCSLNFLYRDNGPRDREKRKTKSIEELVKIVSFNFFAQVLYNEIQRCCDKKCIAQFAASEEIQFWREKVENGKCKGELHLYATKSNFIISDKREVFYDMKEHAIQPCEMAIKEITHLSKATINNLRSKVCAPQLNYKPFLHYSQIIHFNSYIASLQKY